MAKELGKDIYVFVCGDDFPYDPHEAEDEERQALQREHRRRLLASDKVFEQVSSVEALHQRILALQTLVEELMQTLGRQRRRWHKAVAVAGIALAAIGAMVWRLADRMSATQTALAGVLTSLEEDRRYVEQIARNYVRLQNQSQEEDLTPEEIWSRATAQTAQDAGIGPEDALAKVQVFVDAVRQDPQSVEYDRALAAFASGSFDQAAELARLSVEETRRRRASLQQTETDLRDQGRRALTLEAMALFAAREFERAVATYDEAVTPVWTSRVEQPLEWADLVMERAKTLSVWADYSEGEQIGIRNTAAAAGFRTALEVCTRETEPQDWAWLQHNLGIALKGLARTAVGAECELLLREAEAAHREALLVWTSDESLQHWAIANNSLANVISERAVSRIGEDRYQMLSAAAEVYRSILEACNEAGLEEEQAMAQCNLGICLRDMASVAEEQIRASLLADSIAAYREALRLLPRESEPEDWALTQTNLGAALRARAAVVDGELRSQCWAAAVEAFTAALTELSREEQPRLWASAQSELADTFSDMAFDADAAQRRLLLDRAVAAYRASLVVFTKDGLPSDWITTQNNLGSTLLDLAFEFEGPEHWRLLQDAKGAFLAAMEVCTLESDPHGWALIQKNLGVTLGDLAEAAEDSQRQNLLHESIAAFRASLVVRTRESDPEDWYGTTKKLAEAHLALIKCSAAEARPALVSDCLGLLQELVTADDDVASAGDREHWNAMIIELTAADHP